MSIDDNPYLQASPPSGAPLERTLGSAPAAMSRTSIAAGYLLIDVAANRSRLTSMLVFPGH